MNIKPSLLFLILIPIAALVFACGGDKKVLVVGAPPTPDGGATVTPGDDDDVAGDDDDAGTSSGSMCTAAGKKLLSPQTTVSKGEVNIVETAGGVSKIYIDASAGGSGPGVAAKNPRVYVKMDGTKVEINDVDAATSTEWDLAFKRVDIFTNGGDGGPGKGAGLVANKAFDKVTAADADGIAQESFFHGDCEPSTDEGGFLLTTLSSWYDYDQMTHIPTPFLDRTLVIKAADGTLYKVGLLSYRGNADGTTTGGETGQFVYQVKKL